MTHTNDIIISEVVEALEIILNKNTTFTPKFLSDKFQNMGSKEQGEFFNELSTFVKGWDGDPSYQWEQMKNYLNEDGKALLDSMKYSTDKEYQP
jgi:hypothetical protein